VLLISIPTPTLRHTSGIPAVSGKHGKSMAAVSALKLHWFWKKSSSAFPYFIRRVKPDALYNQSQIRRSNWGRKHVNSEYFTESMIRMGFFLQGVAFDGWIHLYSDNNPYYLNFLKAL